jgi:hypothetical protein
MQCLPVKLSSRVRQAIQFATIRHLGQKEPYEEFVRRSKANPIGRIVKISDVYDNMSPERRIEPPSDLAKKMERYERALAELTRD